MTIDRAFAELAARCDGDDGRARPVRACRPSDYAPAGWGERRRRKPAPCATCNEPINPRSKCLTCGEIGTSA